MLVEPTLQVASNLLASGKETHSKLGEPWGQCYKLFQSVIYGFL
jgi:hypothetical protein